jgi:HAD superfamily hydrolase (TIGR01509 family)
MIRAVAFDFDGVIANSEPLHFRAFRDVLATEGITLNRPEYTTLPWLQRRARVPRDWRGTRTPLGRACDCTPHLTQGAGHRRTRTAWVDPSSPVREAIEQLARRCPLAIASGALRSEIERILERERLKAHFAVIVSADDGGASKPAPDPYLRAVERLSKMLSKTTARSEQLRPSDCVAVEDSPWGLESARAAGLLTVGVAHTYTRDALAQADVVVDTIAKLTWKCCARWTGNRIRKKREKFAF